MKLPLIFLIMASCAMSPVEPETAGELTCDAAAVENLAGQTYSDSIGKQAVRRSKSGTLRVIRPGQPVTMDYRTDRLNIEIDEGGKIMVLRCG